MYIADFFTAVPWSRSLSHLLSLTLPLFSLFHGLFSGFHFPTHLSACVLYCYSASGYIAIISREFRNVKAVGSKFHSSRMKTQMRTHKSTHTHTLYSLGDAQTLTDTHTVSVSHSGHILFGAFPRKLNPWEPRWYSGPECSCHYSQYKATVWAAEENPDQWQHHQRERLHSPEQYCR